MGPSVEDLSLFMADLASLKLLLLHPRRGLLDPNYSDQYPTHRRISTSTASWTLATSV